MEGGPSELSLAEIRKFMLENGCKVTNHALVKHFKQFLTNPQSQNEARKQFKTYVNILATIKNDDNQKYLLLRKRYLSECPSEDIVNRTEVPMSPGASSITSDGCGSPFRQPPPYKAPPEVSPSVVKCPQLQSESKDNYRECVNEFAAAVRKIDPAREVSEPSPTLPPRNKPRSDSIILSRENSQDDNKENIICDGDNDDSTLLEKSFDESEMENSISVKEATRKFNRMASEEEAKIISPQPKKKPEKQIVEENMNQEVSLSHPKAKEWIVASAKANYQEMAKLASEYPELVKLQDPTTGTALHWAAKHDNEDIVKLIAGTYRGDVNARTGYTPLHIAMQFGRDNIFALLCNVYKANRDLMDWSGQKALDYRKQRTSVSASTYSSKYFLDSTSVPTGGTLRLARKKHSHSRYATATGISLHRTQSLMRYNRCDYKLYIMDLGEIKARRKHTEKDMGFLRIGSLNVRVKKTTEAFSNFLGVGGGNTTLANIMNPATLPHHHPQQHIAGKTNMSNAAKEFGTTVQLNSRASVPSNSTQYDQVHKSWGSADNIPKSKNQPNHMPPPKDSNKKRKEKPKNTEYTPTSGYSSMPNTPNQTRATIGMLSLNTNNMDDTDSDSACGFGSSWSINGRDNPDLMQPSCDPKYV